MIDLIVLGGLAALGALFAVTLSKDVQQRVAQWLREHGLANSALMDAVVYLEKVGSTIRASVRVMTRTQHTEILTLERTYSIDQIDDPAVRAALQQHDRAQQNVMTLFNAA